MSSFNTRKSNVLTQENTLEVVDTLEQFPVSMSCVNFDKSKDKFLDMTYMICNKTGVIQMKDYPLLEDIYIDAHNTSFGAIWNNLFEFFTQKLGPYMHKKIKILEIGGGSLLLASKILTCYPNVEEYHVFEQNLSHKYTDNEKLILHDSYFTQDTELQFAPDIVIHSHVLEHVWNPREFIKCISSVCHKNSLHFFIAPNLQVTFAKKYTNALNFEHNFFIIEPYIDVILNNNNFDILEKEPYLDHSLIYLTKFTDSKKEPVGFPNLYEKNKKLLIDFFDYHKNLVKDLNNKISQYKHNGYVIYLFGAHIFSQYLIKFGLDTKNIETILDNSPQKNKRRLYGTDFMVKFPSEIKNKQKCAIVLKAASYQKEISDQLKSINPDIVILE
jgi:2-polyprenyl-3-methyl-5-hydroxy-6-metoxy-1,4-benzoquinol methylase